MEAIPTGQAEAFQLLRSLIEMDDEQLARGRCGPGRNRQPYGSLFENLFHPRQAAITEAVRSSPTFAEACHRTAALILPDTSIPPGTQSRWLQPHWRWNRPHSP